MIEIGKYKIVIGSTGKCWIEIINNGEGMECNTELLEKCIDDFYVKNF